MGSLKKLILDCLATKIMQWKTLDIKKDLQSQNKCSEVIVFKDPHIIFWVNDCLNSELYSN